MRYAGRRSGQQSRGQDEEYGEDKLVQDDGKVAPRSRENDNVVADLAKSLVEAQTKMAVASGASADKAMLAMLEKISRQLEELRQPPTAAQPALSSTGGEQQAASPKGNAAATGDLAALFSQLLQGEGAKGAKGEGGGQQQSAQAGAGGGQSRDTGSKAGGGQSQGQKTGDTAATAAQMLAQAQYELANELENSLAKLKQVIDESEKLADKISSLLGQENSENPS